MPVGGDHQVVGGDDLIVVVRRLPSSVDVVAVLPPPLLAEDLTSSARPGGFLASSKMVTPPARRRRPGARRGGWSRRSRAGSCRGSEPAASGSGCPVDPVLDRQPDGAADDQHEDDAGGEMNRHQVVDVLGLGPTGLKVSCGCRRRNRRQHRQATTATAATKGGRARPGTFRLGGDLPSVGHPDTVWPGSGNETMRRVRRRCLILACSFPAVVSVSPMCAFAAMAAATPPARTAMPPNSRGRR